MVGLGQQWMAAPAWMAASELVGNGSRVMSARSNSTFLHSHTELSDMGCLFGHLARPAVPLN